MNAVPAFCLENALLLFLKLTFAFCSSPSPALCYATYNPHSSKSTSLHRQLLKNDFLPLTIKIWFSYKASKRQRLRRTWEVFPPPSGMMGSPGGSGPLPAPTTVFRLHSLILSSLNICQSLLSELQIYISTCLLNISTWVFQQHPNAGFPT